MIKFNNTYTNMSKCLHHLKSNKDDVLFMIGNSVSAVTSNIYEFCFKIKYFYSKIRQKYLTQ